MTDVSAMDMIAWGSISIVGLVFIEGRQKFSLEL